MVGRPGGINGWLLIERAVLVVTARTQNEDQKKKLQKSDRFYGNAHIYKCRTPEQL